MSPGPYSWQRPAPPLVPPNWRLMLRPVSTFHFGVFPDFFPWFPSTRVFPSIHSALTQLQISSQNLRRVCGFVYVIVTLFGFSFSVWYLLFVSGTDIHEHLILEPSCTHELISYRELTPAVYSNTSTNMPDTITKLLSIGIRIQV